MSAGAKGYRAAAAAVIGVIAAGLGVLAWAFYELQGRYGPNYGARLPDGRVVLASHGSLHVFERETRVARVPFKELGLGAVIGDLDAVGEDALLVGDADSRTLRLCRLAQRSCTLFYDGSAYPGGSLRRAFKAAVEPGTGRVVVSDASNHRLLLLDARGRLLHSTPKSGPLFTFPNGIAFLPDGTLAVADTDHRRIAFVKAGGEALAAENREVRLRRVLPGTDLLHPIDVVSDAGGRLWMVLANNSLETGAVASMQPDGARPRHAPLPDAADPLSLLPLDEAMLILEPTTFRATRVALDGGGARPFGDRRFQDELRAEAQWRSRMARVRLGAQATLVLALIAALAIAWLSGTIRAFPQLRPRWKVPETPPPLDGAIDWVEANPFPGRSLLYGGLAAVLLACAGGYLWLQSGVKGSEEEWSRLQLLLVGLVLVALLLVLTLGRMSRGRLGTDGETLFVEDAGRRFRVPLAEVLYSRRRLLAGSRLVALRLPAGDRYPSERIAAAILARLPATAQASEWRLDRTFLARNWRALLSRLQRTT